MTVSQYKLGEMYYKGFGVPKEHKKAKELFQLASISGYAPAQYALGMLYFYGNGIKTDFIEGCKWLNLSAQQGYHPAINEYTNKCSR